jgi:hypothetical protein
VRGLRERRPRTVLIVARCRSHSVGPSSPRTRARSRDDPCKSPKGRVVPTAPRCSGRDGGGVRPFMGLDGALPHVGLAVDVLPDGYREVARSDRWRRARARSFRSCRQSLAMATT